MQVLQGKTQFITDNFPRNVSGLICCFWLHFLWKEPHYRLAYCDLCWQQFYVTMPKGLTDFHCPYPPFQIKFNFLLHKVSVYQDSLLIPECHGLFIHIQFNLYWRTRPWPLDQISRCFLLDYCQDKPTQWPPTV